MDDVWNWLTATDGYSAWTWDINQQETKVVHNAVGLSRLRFQAMDFSYDSLYLASCSSTNKFHLTSVNKNRISSCENSTENINTTVKFANASRYLAFGTSNNKVILYDLKNRKPRLEFLSYGNQNELKKITALYSYPDDSHIVSGDSNGNIAIHSCSNGTSVCAFSYAMHMSITKLKCKSEKKNIIVSGYESGAVLFSDVYTNKTVCSYEDAHFSPVTSLVSSSMLPSTVISTGFDKRVLFYDMRMQKRYEEREISYIVVCSDLNASGSILAVGTENGFVQFYDLRKFSEPIKEVSTSLDKPIQCVNFHKIQNSASSSKNAASPESLTLIDEAEAYERSRIRISCYDESSDFDDVFSPIRFETNRLCKNLSLRLNNTSDATDQSVDSFPDSSCSHSPELQLFNNSLKKKLLPMKDLRHDAGRSDILPLSSSPKRPEQLKKIPLRKEITDCINLMEFEAHNEKYIDTNTGLRSSCNYEMENYCIVQDGCKEACNLNLKSTSCKATKSVQTEPLKTFSGYNHPVSLEKRLEQIELSLDSLRLHMFDMFVSVHKFIEQSKKECIEEVTSALKNAEEIPLL